MRRSLLIITLAFHCLFSFAQQIKSDSITVAIEPEYNRSGRVHRVLFGENYRILWATPVTLKVFRLENEKGGLKILQKGGGLQTLSLRLQGPDGQQWVLRTIQKYPERGLPPGLRPTVVKDILQDQVSAAHPFSALTVPPMAEALGIPHSHPEIVYVADDPALGTYSKDFAGKVFLFEEREPVDVEKTEKTEKVQEKLAEDNDNHLDEKLVLRARLLDMILGDWDRHEDQWRWEKINEGKGSLYLPVPRDRDQVYYKTSGVFPWIVSHQWLKSKFQGYSKSIRDIEGWNFNARYFDRYFLNGLSEADWREQIALVQKTLTDSLITAAMDKMPAPIVKLCAREITGKMRARRDNLLKEALEYYRFISIYVDIPATDKREHFSLTEQDDGDLEVTIEKIRKDSSKRGRTIYHRVFQPGTTREVRLYGFDGDDVFSVSGSKPSSIKVRMIGGAGMDSFYIDRNLHGRRRIYIYDRSDSLNMLPSGRAAKIRTATDPLVNSYDRTSFKYDRFEPIILAHYNTDIGVLLVGGFSYEKHGFRSEPYAFRTELLTNYSISRKSLLFTYTADFKNAIGANGIRINALSRGPNNVSNFFGIGNGAPFVNKGDKDIRYYRNKFDWITGDVSLYHDYGNWHVSAGPGFQFYTSRAAGNANRFLKFYDSTHAGEDIFATKWYAGFVADVNYDTRDKSTLSTHGLYWNTTFTGMQGVSHSNSTFGLLSSEFSFLLNPDRNAVLIIANRTGGATYFGTADYFQQVKLGGPQTLRGYHTWRFTGRSTLYNNLEVRLKVLDFTSYLLPGSIGLIGFNDIGRVWSKNDTSNDWHDGYGGGIYIIPAELLLIQAAIGFSREGSLPYISIGFTF
ncbi:hypothetical protein Q4E93_19050 [Flavitalea sp. BT771]|uniref:hypothetical protein n=1 Tax=Flavitalea sp. BT771 TaxID=3063329 RepID=UPI0026E2A359|nr:hypothetical protein [Flavitalea sp. BT771]MDO6432712.1 hypothetical protein [Flavitalea sp. BT771]MDV6222012.1 hypothetical protein [Flavitalea sp. BT771]